MREIELKVLVELMKNSKLSDREVAEKVGSSQPTVTRTRKRLEKEGYIREYTLIPDFAKLGFEILAVTFVKFTEDLTPDRIREVKRGGRELEGENPTPTMLIMRGIGFGYEGVILSLHESYSSFTELIRKTKQLPFVDISEVESFVVSLDDDHYRPLSLSHLARHLLKLGKETQAE